MISISLTEDTHLQVNRFVLAYSDNGFWSENSVPSFGTEIIQAMSEQLEGSFSLETGDSGTKYVFDLANLS